ncbi:type I iodothyronine deiodinase [Eurytemora carolleeae]|uniref:type I iodothyronine deiodinase n=1 Tax=Eurytemora carolleeae TaxID=1294199 RepID=UPI000C777B77|nr:type I iodothyronine deiodinase [Eurytemora carolleeae]|eukprot:XP_023335135.1 type I iodothyronine deiodinase-like [Eurytemora affinis]
MGSLSKFSGIRAKFGSKVDFITVYIEEAHPSNKDHFKGNIDIQTHQHLQDRLEAARYLRSEAAEDLKGCPILVDRMDDAANKAYGAHPERLYAILDGNIVYEGGMGPFNYSIEDLENCLETRLNMENTKSC